MNLNDLRGDIIVDIGEVHGNLVLHLKSGNSIFIKNGSGFGPNIDFEWNNGTLIEEEVGDKSFD
jgi:hypothetical protein